MKISQNDTIEAVDLCLKLLEPVKVKFKIIFLIFINLYKLLQLHNAHQLAEYCMQYCCVNYNTICRHVPKSLKLLHPDNQEYLLENRWPPVW